MYLPFRFFMFISLNPLDCKRVSTALVLCISIAANIGGTGMLTGTAPNLVMVGQLQDYAEKSVICCFVLLLSLWMFRNPGFMKGFGALLPKGSYTDATSAIIVAILLFALPSEKPDLLTYKTKEDINKQCRLMDWPTMQKRFPWNVVLLLGGGFALAAGVKESGLSVMVGRTLAAFNQLPLWVMQMVTMAVVMAITNICSNTVTATVFVPIVATMGAEMKRHPFTLMIPATLSCSFAFVLPVGTPSNAIVFSSGMVKVYDMVGVLLSLTLLLL
ncbi:unnamed protein product [Angiostrongylus costaricensis]|uniref:CitMHS domain-containing protein n=1 Tax=Angiostrongylus costaricensis TaxID=334426 RepID=A0A0R3PGZ6_ANGCS|nr:unnamed protein product [Angiostrongylus costaricensis]